MSWQYSARFLSVTAHECYLEVSQLAAIAGRTSRIMQKNLADLEAKQIWKRSRWWLNELNAKSLGISWG